MKTLLMLASVVIAVGANAQLTLGSYTFNNNQFGNTLVEGDGGTFSAGNWLNTTDADPGNPAYLTGANVETGIANIGLNGSLSYTIGYNTPIVNGVGNDLGVIVARYSSDPFYLAVSQDGTNFTSDLYYDASTAVATGVSKTYWYGGAGPYSADLYVQTVDLSDFGLGLGDSVKAVRVTGYTQLDLVRVAGLNPVPEPTTIVALGLGALALARRRRRA